VLRLGEDYALSDLLLGADRAAINALSVRVSQGLKLFGARTDGIAGDAPRQNEQNGFTKVNFEASRTQTLFAPWEGASVALMGLLAGQWSNAILPPAEQFYLGGARFTRGYYAGQVPGDKALAATAELQLNTGFETTLFGKSMDISTQFYAFYDWGETWQNRADHALCRGRSRRSRTVQSFSDRRRLRGLLRQSGFRTERCRILLAGADAILTKRLRASCRPRRERD
jgi:hemolysin activation/secretion protein